MVEQARFLTPFNPKFRNRTILSRSVLREINEACRRGTQVFVYQDPAHDPEEKFGERFPAGGTMEPGPVSQSVQRMKSVEAIFDAVEAVARKLKEKAKVNP